MPMPTLGKITAFSMNPGTAPVPATFLFAVDDGSPDGNLVFSAESDNRLIMLYADPLGTAASETWVIIPTTRGGSGDGDDPKELSDHWHVYAWGYHWISYSVTDRNEIWLIQITNNRDGTFTVENEYQQGYRRGAAYTDTTHAVILEYDEATNDHYLVADSDELHIGVFYPHNTTTGRGPGSTILTTRPAAFEVGDKPDVSYFGISTATLAHKSLASAQVHELSGPGGGGGTSRVGLFPRKRSGPFYELRHERIHVLAPDQDLDLSVPGTFPTPNSIVYLVTFTTFGDDVTKVKTDRQIDYDSASLLVMATQVVFDDGWRVVTYRAFSVPDTRSDPSDDYGNVIQEIWDSADVMYSQDTLSPDGTLVTTDNISNRPHTMTYTGSDGFDYLVTCLDTSDSSTGCVVIMQQIT